MTETDSGRTPRAPGLVFCLLRRETRDEGSRALLDTRASGLYNL